MTHKRLLLGLVVLAANLAAVRTAVATTPALDWGSAFNAVWYLDEASDGTSAVTRPKSAGSCPGSDCDLTDEPNTLGGFAPSDAVNAQQGPRSAVFADEQTLDCAAASCNEVVPVSGESVTAGCWARHTATTYGPLLASYSGGSIGGWYLDSDQAAPNHDSIAFGVGNSGPATVEANSGAGTLPLGTWTHVVGRFDNGGAAARVFINGAASGTSTAPTDFNATPPASFVLSAPFVGYSWDGNLDECFVIKTPLSDTDICRICSCGIDGSLCECDDSDGTVYSVAGSNATECGSCALPACNAAAPGSAPTPTPTDSGTPAAPTPTPTDSGTPAAPTPTPTDSGTPAAPTPTPTDSGTPAAPTATPTASATITPTPSATPTAVPALDWGSAFTAAWYLDEVSNGTSPVTRAKSAGTCAGATCDLTDDNTVPSDAVNQQQGPRSATFTAANLEALSCASCTALKPAAGQSVTAGCWTRHTAGSYGPMLSVFGGATGGWYLDTHNADATHTSVAFGVGPSGPATVQATTAAGTLPLDTWAHVVGRFDNAGGQGQIFVNGQTSGAAASQSGFGTAPSAFSISAQFGGYAWDGQLDECFVTSQVLTAVEICRLCSCGIDGTLCACDAGTPADYTDTGRNAGQCGSCALPACNAAPPNSPTPTPTQTATPPPATATPQAATPTPTPTDSGTPAAPTPTPTDSGTPAAPTPTPTDSGTPVAPTATPTASATITPTPSATPTAAPALDWGSAFTAAWYLDEVSNGTSPVTRAKSAGTCAGATCDLTDTNTVPSDAVNQQQGPRSATFTAANLEALSCASCTALKPAAGQSVTAGCWTRHTAGSYGPMLSVFGGATGGWYLDTHDADATHTSVAFGVGPSGPATVQATTAAGTLPLDTWAHVVGRFDNTGGQGQIFVNGQTSGAAASQSGFGTAPGAFSISQSVGGYGWDGQLDECFVTSQVLTAAEICRLCSCGIDGTLCTCDAGTPASYTDTGRNAGQCGSCTLPTCNAFPPGAPTPTPTLSATPTVTPTATATQTAPEPTMTPTPIAATPTQTGTPGETSTPAGTATPTATPTGVPICAPAPETCPTPAIAGKAQLSLQDKSPDTKDQLTWKWLRGPATEKTDFGNPVTLDDYALCIYDANGLLASLSAPAGGTCASKDCWTDRPTGFSYKDKDLTPDGLAQILLKQGVDGKAQIIVKGKGADLPMPDLSTLASPVTVQLRRTDGGGCWGAVYSFPPASKNDATTFKDKAD